MRIFCIFSILVSSVFGQKGEAEDFGRIAQSTWRVVGSTSTDCAFSASFDLLEGYPFGRISKEEEGAWVVRPMVLSQAQKSFPSDDSLASFKVHYVEVLERSYPPTYSVHTSGSAHSGMGLQYWVTESRSGLQHSCLLSSIIFDK
jgi:hypothetical protein